jgi:uncharacterized membrane protein YeiH
MTEPLQHLQLALEIIATISLALSGLISAARKQLDPVGLCMVSGVAAFGGGTLRDIFCNEIPKAFSDHQPYALCALLGGSALVLLQHLGLPDSLALIAAFGLTSVLRILTILKGWRMPGWRV